MGRETAAARRDAELRALQSEGLPIYFQNRWTAIIGDLVIWPAAGRWWHKGTGKQGRLNSDPVRAVIERETIVGIMSALERLDALLEQAKKEYRESVKRNEMPPSCGLAIGTALTGASQLVQQARSIARFQSRREENGAGAARS